MNEQVDGATPLNQEEILGLIPEAHTHHELNLLERGNIARGLKWALKSRYLRKEFLSVSAMSKLHEKMFGDVWEWAGQFRKTEKNIGIAPHQIQSQLLHCCENTEYQMDDKSVDLDEIAVRLHYEITRIHPFPNGNGRYARLSADLLLEFQGRKPFSWRGKDLAKDLSVRKAYITALKKADSGDIMPLLKYARG